MYCRTGTKIEEDQEPFVGVGKGEPGRKRERERERESPPYGIIGRRVPETSLRRVREKGDIAGSLEREKKG